MAIARTSKEQLKNVVEGHDDIPAATGGKGRAFQGEVSEWARADESMKDRLIVVASAPQKSGKTHFGLSAPSKKRGKRSGLGYFAIDRGDEGVIQKFQKKKEIYRCEMRIDIPRPTAKGYSQTELDKTSENAGRLWDKFLDRYNYALEHFRSIVIDTDTELWEIHRLARFGKLEQVKPHHYGIPNNEHRELFRMAYDCDVNLVVLQKMKDEYVNDQFTGRLKAAGFKDAPYQAQVNVRLGRVQQEDGAGFLFSALIESSTKDTPGGGCRLNPDVEGTLLTQPDCGFKELAMLILPDSDEAEWE